MASETHGPAAMGLQLKICRDAWGAWSVHGLSALPVSHLPSLSASIDYARKGCAASPATIELLIDGFYMVVHQELGWPRRLLAPDAEQPCLDMAETDLSGAPMPRRFLAWLRGRDAGDPDCDESSVGWGDRAD
jgi:hypothetical protein